MRHRSTTTPVWNLVDHHFHFREDVAQPHHELVFSRMRGLPLFRGDVENPEALLNSAAPRSRLLARPVSIAIGLSTVIISEWAEPVAGQLQQSMRLIGGDNYGLQ